MSAGYSGESSRSSRTVREEVDRLLSTLRRSLSFWKRALIVFVVVAAVGVPLALSAPRLYRSETVVLYQETMRSTDLTGREEGVDSARRVGARLREVLLSRASLEPIVSDMHLSKATDKQDLIDAVDDMRKRIIFKAREGDTFEIAFDGGTPEEAQEVTRRLAETIVQEASNRRSEHAKTLKEFLDAESDRNKIDLRTKEADLAKFLSLHPEFAQANPGVEVHSPGAVGRPGGRPMSPDDTALAALEWKAARIERQLKATPGAPPPPRPTATAPPPQLPDSPELVAARRDFEDKSSRFTDKHPDVIAARNRLRAAEAAQAAAQSAADAKAAAAAHAAEEAPAPIPATDEDREALKRELADLRQIIAARRGGKAAKDKDKDTAPSAPSASGEPKGSVALEVEYRRLQREVGEARERQRQLDDKAFKASITASSVMNDRNIQVSVLDPAYLPTHPITRPRRLLFGGALLAALALALLTALISVRLDDRIHDRVDLEVLSVLPVMGVIPQAKALPKKSG